MRWTALLIALSACGSPSGHPTDAASSGDSDASVDAPANFVYAIAGAKSGTRLKQRWLETADGMVHPAVFAQPYDSLLAFDCWGFEVLTNGKRVCAPNPNTAGTVLYTDAGCTAAVTNYISTTGPPPIVVQYTATGKLVNFYAPVASITPPPTYYMLESDGCHSYVTQPIERFSSIAPLDLVEVALDYRGTEQLRQGWWTTSDGYNVPAFGYANDTLLDSSCRVSQNSGLDVSAPCRPDLAAIVTSYSTSGCTGPLGETQQGPPKMAQYPGSPDAVYAIGAAVIPSAIFKPGACTQQQTPNPLSQYYPVLGQIGTVAQASISLDPPNGHRLLAYTFGSGLDMRTGWFHDTLLDIDCGFGSTACVPSRSASVSTLYADTACATPIEFYVRYPTTTSVPMFAGSGTEYRRVTTEHTASLYYKTSTDCEPTMFDFPTGTRFYDLGPVIPLSDFEQATYYVDP